MSPTPTTATSLAPDHHYYYYSNSSGNRIKNSPSPNIIFPASSPTPKLSCNTPSIKPVSPFDWARECMLDDQQEASGAAGTMGGWNQHHFEEMERIGKELEHGDAMALERLREKANPTPEERCVLSWIDSSLQQQQEPSNCSPSPFTLDSLNSSSSASLHRQEEHQQSTPAQQQQQQQRPATSFLAFLNRFKKAFKVQ
ncbi:hypothetical protein BDB00DRAFT_874408 [Zychaea mexicana]|uniref:uncharacterized protein n=1 Tax=Zychaea mexicana TaxID=64656 RepID=UPI0022FEBE5B|nr:uncharacterized protein BDB00DRAFT_874408 [Zychaea mexicana]KAI9491364.1 hypothetical protein BDB00DRAFT_874408 [Zychaea mexicana]